MSGCICCTINPTIDVLRALPSNNHVPHIRLINDECEYDRGIGAKLYGLGGAASC